MSRLQVHADTQWELIADQLPKPQAVKGRLFADARMVVEDIIYRYRCGIAWRVCQRSSVRGRRYGHGTGG
ncbi:transposase [Nesterenkonia alkaliphila]|uniref:Transposase n=1 Tax=Nesterenkonia alkaliphila TaxID=1463631 RepID=A0A7K1UL58_9MICC|nr:transposase [Nesterenkonia alkaliphila]GFZ99963.1 hypothetical protein GCM10011359_30900 [Nesterenkonia alkaliphila]